MRPSQQRGPEKTKNLSKMWLEERLCGFTGNFGAAAMVHQPESHFHWYQPRQRSKCQTKRDLGIKDIQLQRTNAWLNERCAATSMHMCGNGEDDDYGDEQSILFLVFS
jgi:hypothetical protein